MRTSIVAGGFVVLAMSIAAQLPHWTFPHWAFEATTKAAAAEPPAPAAQTPGVPVTSGIVTAADVPVLLNAIGTVQPFNMVTIKSRVDGQIMKVMFTEGKEVQAGEPLFQIDPRPFDAALQQAQSTKDKDEAQLKMAESDLARWAELVPQGVKSQQTYDQTKALVSQMQAAIKGDEAMVNTAKLNLNYADIRAPINGRLGARLVDVGNMVRASDSTGLVTIAQMKPIFVTFSVSQGNIDRLREEKAKGPIEVMAFAGGDDKTELGVGKISLIDNAIDQATGTIRLKATFPNDHEKLWPGRFANLRVILSVRKDVPTVPQETVQVGPNGYYAYVIKDDGTVERRQVDVTAMQDGIVVIGKGLKVGEKVVVDGQYRLTAGARVREVPPKAAAAAG